MDVDCGLIEGFNWIVVINKWNSIKKRFVFFFCNIMIVFLNSMYERDLISILFVEKNYENVFLLIGIKLCDNVVVFGIGWVENIFMEIN